MERRILAMAAGAAVLALLGIQPAAAATQCVQACDHTYQECSANSANNQVCLPKWGQCKKACTGPVATKPAAAPAAVTTPAKTTAPTAKAKVTKVASSSKTKTSTGH